MVKSLSFSSLPVNLFSSSFWSDSRSSVVSIFSYHILKNILNMYYYNRFVWIILKSFWQKKSLYNIPYRKLSQNYKQHPKTRKIHALPHLYTTRTHGRTTCISVKKHPLVDVLQNRCSWKFCRVLQRTPTLETFLNKVAGLDRP